MNKYRNIKTEVDGIKFDSKAEAKYYEHLKLLQAAGEIKILALQPKFTLQDKFSIGKLKFRAITYKADFHILDKQSNEIVIDVKGMKTKAYILKKKMFLHDYVQSGKYKFWEVKLTNKAFIVEEY